MSEFSADYKILKIINLSRKQASRSKIRPIIKEFGA